MKIFEVSSPVSPETGKLLALASFMQARAKDTGAQSQVDKNTFLKMASNMGISLSNDQLVELSNQPPLSGVMLPVDPLSSVIKFKGDVPEAPAMPDPNQSQAIVAAAAKSAMKRDR
jgi:hypothetical protein